MSAVAGVSVTTASDALRGRGRMSVETRQRVLQAAWSLGYRTNPNARALRLPNTRMLLFHLDPDTTVYPDGTLVLYWYRVLSGFIAAADRHGYSTLVDLGTSLPDLGHLPTEAVIHATFRPDLVTLPEDLGFGALWCLPGEFDGHKPVDDRILTAQVGYPFLEMGQATAGFFRDQARAKSVLILHRNPQRYHEGRIAQGFGQVFPKVTTLQIPQELTMSARKRLIEDALRAHPEIDGIFDFANQTPGVMRVVSRVRGANAIGNRNHGVTYVRVGEVPPPHFLDERVGYLTPLGVRMGEELADYVAARLGGIEKAPMKAAYEIVPPLSWQDEPER